MKLITVAVLCYRNWEFLTEAIDSVLEQDYAKIELIVSDDGSPDFPKETIERYIEKHKKENIISYQIRQEKTNVGTVRHLNHNVQIANGEWLCFLAADDVFYSCRTLSNYANHFDDNENTMIIMAQTAMYDRELEKLQGYYLMPHIQAAMSPVVDYDKLYHYLSVSPCLPTTSTCYRKKMFEEYGYFDEEYSLIEDYPLHLKMAQNHIPMQYHNFLAIKHRDGGISHGATTALTATRVKYYSDLKKCYEVICKNPPNNSAEERREIIKRAKNNIRQLDWLIMKSKPFTAIKYFMKYPGHALMTLIKLVDACIGKFSSKIVIFIFVFLLGIPTIESAFSYTFHTDFTKAANGLSAIGVNALFISVVLVIIHYLARFINSVERFPIEDIYILSK